MSKFISLFLVLFLSFSNLSLAEEVPLTAEYRVDTMWATAYQVTVKLTNKTNQTINSWTTTFKLPQQNVLSSHISGGEFFGNKDIITVKNLDSNGTILPNGSVTFNMIINMPQGGKTTIDNLVASGNNGGPPTSDLVAPVLNPISKSSERDYTVSWNRVANATLYYLEVDTNSNFPNPKVVSQTDVNSFNVTNQTSGTYYYRVASGNSSSKSSFSNVESITIASSGSQVSLNAAYKVDTVWATAFQVTVTLTNKGNVSVKDWVATFSLPNGFVLSSNVSSGVFSTNGQVVTVKNIAANANIAPNASVTFSMIINKPSGTASVINSLQALGSVNSTPIPVPSSPVLTVTSGTSSNYIVSWNAVTGATSYTLQEDTDERFVSPTNIVQANVLSQNFINKPTDTYFYRVFATNSGGNSGYSNVVDYTVINNTPIPPRDTIEYSVWYIDWTSWIARPYVIPKNINMLNIFVGKFTYDANGKPTMGGFGTFTDPLMKDFVQVLAQQQPPIKAKVSIGGGGGSYDRTWDLLTSSNIKAFAQGMVDFCHNIGLAGVDFDYEAFSSPEQETLVGKLIKEFKLIDPNLQTSLCSNAGFGPNFPWQASVKNILDAAMISPGNCAVDRFYIMTYYNSMSDEIGWVVGSDGKGGWANWLITNYGFTRARISIGIDDFDAHAYDANEFRAWAGREGFSVAHWAFDPARPPQ